MKKIILLFSIISFTFLSNSQNNKLLTDKIIPQKSIHQIGFSAGGVTGIGFSYRYWPNQWGVQFTTIPVFFKNNSGSFTSIGVSALYTIRDRKYVDLYAYFGNHFINAIDKNYNIVNGETVISKNNSILYNIGGGFGFKVHFLDNLEINLQNGLGLFLQNNINTTTFTLTSELGLYYQF